MECPGHLRIGRSTVATRGRRRSFEDAQAAINRLAAVPTHPGFVLHEIALLRLRALLARAHGDEASSRGRRPRRQPGMLETSQPGVFAAGDVRSGSVKRVASAVGEGSMAVRQIDEHFGV